MVVAGVETDGAVEDINPMAPQPAAQGQKRGRRMAEHARLAAIVFVKLHVSRPEQRLGFALARMFAMVQTRVHIKRIVVLMIERQAAEEIQMLHGYATGDRSPRIIK